MKQLANQTVGRAKETEDLCEDMSQLKLHLDGAVHVPTFPQVPDGLFSGPAWHQRQRRNRKGTLTVFTQNMHEASA